MSGISEDRFEQLERQVRRLRGLVFVMAAGVVGVLLMGATGKPDELTLRRLAIVDAEGRERIVAETTPDGSAGVSHRDREGKLRINTGTMPDGSAGIAVLNRDEKPTWGEGTD
jgi:hypothetical protein